MILGTVPACAVHVEPLCDGSTFIDVALDRQNWILHQSLCDWAEEFYWELILGYKIHSSLRKAGLSGVLIRVSHMNCIYRLVLGEYCMLGEHTKESNTSGVLKRRKWKSSTHAKVRYENAPN